MFSFLREAPGDDGKPGPLSMRRISAALCFAASIVAGGLALAGIIKFIDANPDTTIDWRAFIPPLIPCIAWLLGGLILLLFTTWTDVREIVSAAKGKG